MRREINFLVLHMVMCLSLRSRKPLRNRIIISDNEQKKSTHDISNILQSLRYYLMLHISCKFALITCARFLHFFWSIIDVV